MDIESGKRYELLVYLTLTTNSDSNFDCKTSKIESQSSHVACSIERQRQSDSREALRATWIDSSIETCIGTPISVAGMASISKGTL